MEHVERPTAATVRPEPVDVVMSVFATRRDLVQVAHALLEESDLGLPEADLLLLLYGIQELGWPDCPRDTEGYISFRDIQKAQTHEASGFTRRVQGLASRRLVETAVALKSDGLHGNSRRLRLTREGIDLVAPMFLRYRQRAAELLRGVPGRSLMECMLVLDTLSLRAKGGEPESWSMDTSPAFVLQSEAEPKARTARLTRIPGGTPRGSLESVLANDYAACWMDGIRNFLDPKPYEAGTAVWRRQALAHEFRALKPAGEWAPDPLSWSKISAPHLTLSGIKKEQIDACVLVLSELSHRLRKNTQVRRLRSMPARGQLEERSTASPLGSAFVAIPPVPVEEEKLELRLRSESDPVDSAPPAWMHQLSALLTKALETLQTTTASLDNIGRSLGSMAMDEEEFAEELPRLRQAVTHGVQSLELCETSISTMRAFVSGTLRPPGDRRRGDPRA